MKNSCYVTLNKNNYWVIARNKPYSLLDKLKMLIGIEVIPKQEFVDNIVDGVPISYHSLVAAKFVAQSINKLGRKPTPNEWIAFYENQTKKNGN